MAAGNIVKQQSLQERVYIIRDKMKVYNATCEQLKLLQISANDTQIRLRRAEKTANETFVYFLGDKLAVIENVRLVFYKVADKLAAELDELISKFEEFFGIPWSEIFELDTDDED